MIEANDADLYKKMQLDMIAIILQQMSQNDLKKKK